MSTSLSFSLIPTGLSESGGITETLGFRSRFCIFGDAKNASVSELEKLPVEIHFSTPTEGFSQESKIALFEGHVSVMLYWPEVELNKLKETYFLASETASNLTITVVAHTEPVETITKLQNITAELMVADIQYILEHGPYFFGR